MMKAVHLRHMLLLHAHPHPVGHPRTHGHRRLHAHVGHAGHAIRRHMLLGAAHSLRLPRPLRVAVRLLHHFRDCPRGQIEKHRRPWAAIGRPRLVLHIVGRVRQLLHVLRRRGLHVGVGVEVVMPLGLVRARRTR